MKKAISIVLLFVFLYNISGYYFVFSVWQISIKEFVHGTLKNKKPGDLIVITLPAGEEKYLEWQSNDEFQLKGKMYDVAYKICSGNKIKLYCHNDTKEEYLFASLNKHIKTNMDSSATGKNSKNKIKNPVSDFYKVSESVKYGCITFMESKKIPVILSPENIYIDFPSPPPRVA